MNNQRHGHGRMQYSNGDAYEGLWVKDHRTGWAKYFYANGDIFVGKYKQNRREGLGTIYMVMTTLHAAAELCTHQAFVHAWSSAFTYSSVAYTLYSALLAKARDASTGQEGQEAHSRVQS